MGSVLWYRSKSKVLRQTSNPSGDVEVSAYLRKAQNVNLDKNIDDARLCCIDLETSGLDLKRSSIISIGGIAIKKRTLDVKDSLFLLVKNEGEMNRESVLIHKITPSLLRSASELDIALKRFLEFIGNDVICAFSPIDSLLLNRDLKRVFGIRLLNPIVDVQKLARALLPSEENFNTDLLDEGWFGLEELTTRIGIPMVQRHTSLGDSYTMALAVVCLIKKYRFETLRELCQLS
ncbi:MAG: 3'-5' exonuclease [archaeon]